MTAGEVVAAGARIGEEIAKVPKATRPHRPGDKKLPGAVNSKKGRAEAMPSGTQRARYQRVAAPSWVFLRRGHCPRALLD
jgi:hypothetical protein